MYKNRAIIKDLYSLFAFTALPVRVLGNFSPPTPARSETDATMIRISAIEDPARRTKGLCAMYQG